MFKKLVIGSLFMAAVAAFAFTGSGARTRVSQGVNGQPISPSSVSGATSVSTTSLSSSSENVGFLDAGQINIGGAAGQFWTTGEICMGTSNGTPTCLSGLDILWNPNSAFFCNSTAGNALKIFGTTVSINGSGGCQAGTFKNIPVTEAANMQRIETGAGAMTGGALAVTFATAFSAAPRCTCTHVNTTNSNACVISVAPSTTAVTFAATSGGTDVVDWICIGDR